MEKSEAEIAQLQFAATLNRIGAISKELRIAKALFRGSKWTPELSHSLCSLLQSQAMELLSAGLKAGATSSSASIVHQMTQSDFTSRSPQESDPSPKDWLNSFLEVEATLIDQDEIPF